MEQLQNLDLVEKRLDRKVVYQGMSYQLWLDRLLIDRAYQGRGYGAGAVAALLERLPKEYGKDRVFLSVYDDNQGAIRLYEKLGFAFNGELDTKGERVMVYTVPRPDAPTEREERERAHDRSV